MTCLTPICSLSAPPYRKRIPQQVFKIHSSILQSHTKRLFLESPTSNPSTNLLKKQIPINPFSTKKVKRCRHKVPTISRKQKNNVMLKSPQTYKNISVSITEVRKSKIREDSKNICVHKTRNLVNSRPISWSTAIILSIFDK